MITLSEYLNFILKEITDARIGLDHYVAEVAQTMAKDEVMKHFQVPRFRMPEMDLNIPVLISGAKYSSTIQFVMDQNEFYSFIIAARNQAIQTLKIRMVRTAFPIGGAGIISTPLNIGILNPVKVNPSITNSRGTKDQNELLATFYQKLVDNSIPNYPDNIVSIFCDNLFSEAMSEEKIESQKIKPEHQLESILDNFTKIVLQKVVENTVIIKNILKNLLVNPETQLIKENSNEFSVFQLKAKINEEGLQIHTVKDENGEKKIVEFE